MPFPYTFEFAFETASGGIDRDISTRIAFATAPFAATPTWADVSADVQSISIRRGRQHEMDRIEAGTATIVLENDAGEYWSKNAGGSHYPNILPVKKTSIRASWDGGVSYKNLFTGYIESMEPQWGGIGGKAPLMVVRCTDMQKNLARFLLNNAGYSAEPSGTRIGNVLDDISFPAGDRDINTGQSSLQATGALANKNGINHLFEVQDTERGILFMDGAGQMVFHDRSARLKAPLVTAQAVFGDDSEEDEYFDIDLALDDEFVYNDIRVTRAGGSEQTAADATSKTAYGHRSLSLTGLLMTTDAIAGDLANFLLARYKDAELRLKSITIVADRNSPNLYPKVLGHDLGTRITVRLNQASLDGDYHIEGIAHDWDKKSYVWRTKWQLSSADVEAYWLIGTAGYGEIGDTAFLGY
ncbi:hypothetical protein CMI37_13935 [Candidatus Pacearchaeota archaeon]|nr:hypothetical protein [Candidatus Pacearchaeota archaeon]|tara:strand:- start:679 stop:1917 length:1239 start_codon:yes stop_codon:yes gene_type:complete